MNDTPSDIRNFSYDIKVFGELIRRAAAVIILPKAVAIMGGIASEYMIIVGDAMPGIEKDPMQGINTPDDIIRLSSKPNLGVEYQNKVLDALDSLEDYGTLLNNYPATTDTSDLIAAAMNLSERTTAIIEPDDNE